MASLVLYEPSLHIQLWRRAVLNALRTAKRTALEAVILVEGWAERARSRRTLAQLDQRMLNDLGISHAQAASEAEKPFWKA